MRERIAERRERRRPVDPYRADPQWEQRLHELLGAPWPCQESHDFWELWSETIARIAAMGVPAGRGAYAGWDDADAAFARAAWCSTRHLRPRRVVETGVARGLSTRIMLEALERNGAGRLWSIDLPPLSDRGLSDETGAAVPDDRRGRWTLLRGSSRRRLPGLLAELREIDLFVHDSMHTERNLRFEIDAAWPALVPGGVLLADDVHRNRVFASSVLTNRSARSVVCSSDDGMGLFGVARKEPQPPDPA